MLGYFHISYTTIWYTFSVQNQLFCKYSPLAEGVSVCMRCTLSYSPYY